MFLGDNEALTLILPTLRLISFATNTEAGQPVHPCNENDFDIFIYYHKKSPTNLSKSQAKLSLCNNRNRIEHSATKKFKYEN